MSGTAGHDTPVVRSLGILLADLIDYAGLFPPAGLSMPAAVANYVRYLAGPDSWALGRFVVPASRLVEFEREWKSAAGDTRCRLSVLLAGEEEMEAALKFSMLHPKWISIDSMETKIATAGAVDRFASTVPPGLPVFLELPLSGDLQPLIASVAKAGARAKVRTGGVVQDAFPRAEDLLRFLSACAAHRVPFKATAGLHHPLRCVRPLTYEPNSPRGAMYGFLNVFLAAVLAWENAPEDEIRALLQEESVSAFTFAEDDVHWRAHRVSGDKLTSVRRDFALSFGSCSFEDPLNDLRNLGLLR